MFADPQSITFNGSAVSLPAISRSNEQSEYKINDGGVVFDLRTGHTFKTRNRVFARLQYDAYSSDPIVPANNILASMTATMTVDFPSVGITAAEAVLLAAALRTWATDANLLKLVNGET